MNWIPVEDSMPEDHEWVLVACRIGDRYDVGIAVAVAKQVRLGFDSPEMVPRVTHWQPMPEPPELV